MPRDITLTFSDGTAHVYKDAPDDITPEQAQARAKTDFPDRPIVHVDGGLDPATRGKPVPVAAAAPVKPLEQLLQDIGPAPAPPPPPGIIERAKTAIGSAAGAVADRFKAEREEVDAARAPAPPSPSPAADAVRAVADAVTRAPTDVAPGTPARRGGHYQPTPRGPQWVEDLSAPIPSKLEHALDGTQDTTVAPSVTPLEAAFGGTIAPGHEADALAAVQQRQAKGIPAEPVPRGTEVRQPNAADDFLAGRAPPAPTQWWEPASLSETDKMVEKVGGAKSAWGQGLRAVADTAVAAARVAPELGKLGTEGLEMLSAGAISSPTKWMEAWDQSLNGMGSAKFHAQQIQLDAIIHNPDSSPADVNRFLSANPLFATEVAIPSAGSMVVGAGGAKLGMRLALRSAAKQGLTGEALAAAGERGAEWGSGIANAAMNGADNFHETQGDPWQKYLSGAIAAAATLGVAHLTEGGAAARAVTGGQRFSANPVANAAANLGASVGKEAAQEFGEQVGQDVGQAVAEGAPLDANAIGKNATMAAVQGGIIGVAGARGGAPKAVAHDSILASVDEVAAKHGLMPRAAAALRDAVVGMEPAQAIGFVERALHGFEGQGMVKRAGTPTMFRQALADKLAATEKPAAESGATSSPAPVAGATADTTPASDVASPPGVPAVSSVGADQGASGPVDASALLGAPAEDDTDHVNAIAAAAHAGAATSPLNEHPEPTEAQKEAGNYRMGHVKLHGLDITIENPQGSTRSGVSPDGTAWSNTMAAHYGYIRGTKAIDGDHVDVFVGPTPSSQVAYVIDQVDPNTGKFDEPKVILGATSEDQARQLYQANYAKDWTGLGAITPLPMDSFKAWVKDGVKSKPLGDISGWKADRDAEIDGHVTRLNQSIDNVRQLADAVSRGAAPSAQSAPTPAVGAPSAPAAPAPQADDLYDQAVGIVRQHGSGSILPVQRQLRIGYNRAARLLEQMQTDGIVGPATADGKRELLKPTEPAAPAAPSSTATPATTARGGAAARGQTNAQHPERVMSSRVLGLISKNLGGLDPTMIADFSTRIPTKTIGKDGRPVVKWRNPPVTGVGQLFRRGGTSDFEQIAHLLEEHGYIPPGAGDAGQRAQDMVQRILAGNGEPQGWEDELAAHEASREAEHQHYLELHAESARELEEERAAILAAADMKPADLDSLDDDMLWDAKGVAHGANPFEGDDHAESGSTEADAAATRRAQEAAPPAPAAAQPPAEDRAPAPQPAPLTAQTPADLEAKAKREAAAKAADDAEQKRLANKAKADAERGEFTLTGSDRPADVAAAAGQGDLLAEPPAAAPAPKPSGNKIFTDDAAAAARARLRSKLGRTSHIGIDPEDLQDAIILSGWHIENGARKFADFARAMLDDLGEWARPYLKSWYMAAKFDPRAGELAKDMSGAGFVEEFDLAHVAPAAAASQETKEIEHAPSPPAPVERDRQDAGDRASAVEADVSPVTDGTAWIDGRPGEPAREGGGGQQGDGGLRDSGAVAGREPGDQPVHRGDRAGNPAEFPARDRDGRRGDDPGVEGAAPEAVAASAVDEAADDVPADLKKRAAQRAAETIASKPGDLANIRATLPYLLPEQQDDVLKAEQRFAKEDGYGMVFTNGTGTGKTFTGLGVIKRFARQGKANILVVVPDMKIMADWVDSGKPLGLDFTPLKDTKDAGKGLTITTYANLGENDALASRAWDHVVADEAHMLMQEKDGGDTKALNALRAITLHPRGRHQRFDMLNRDDIEAARQLREQITSNDKIRNADDTMDAVRDSLAAENAKLEARLKVIDDRLDTARKANAAHVDSHQGLSRPRATFLSATPFAYVPTIDWAEGYLFDYPEQDPSAVGRYNGPTGQQQFMIEHFGYRMKTGKLNKPDAKVDAGLMERQFNAWLKTAGSLSGRVLDVNADYDRKFILVDSAIGNRVDAALKYLGDKSRARGEATKNQPDEINGWSMLNAEAADGFYGPLGHLVRRYLLEAIKAKEVIRHVREHLAMGRKVVVFHDFKKGGSNNPFAFAQRAVPTLAQAKAAIDGERDDDAAQRIIDQIKARNEAAAEFAREFPDLGAGGALAGLLSPIQRFTKEFPNVLLINGDEKPKDLLARYKQFNDDATGPIVALVQSDKNKGWSGHDTTGKHQRVLFNLGLPTQPTKTIQQEGRIYRTGQVSNAMFRYLNTGTTWERWAFASTIAERASTAENLGMGESARALKDAYINAFEDSDSYPAGHEGEGTGGKERDRQANSALTEWDRAKTFYFSQAKKTSRTKAQEGADYFATPEPLGLKMVQWADMRAGEDVLEPSAGHGAIARWFPDTTQRTAIEPSSVLASRMALVFNGDSAKIVTGTFENLHTVNKYDAIVMNPPFGTAGRTAIDHLMLAASHLREGGRIVALIPTGPAADKKFDAWFYGEESRPAKPLGQLQGKDVYAGDTVTTNASWAPEGVLTDIRAGSVFIQTPGAPRSTGVAAQAVKTVKSTGKRTEAYRPAEGLHLVSQVILPASTFERAGTAVMTRVVIIEKDVQGAIHSPIDLTSRDSTEQLFDALENLDMPGRRKTGAPAAAPAAAPAPAARPATAAKIAAREEAATGRDDIVEHTTGKGKVLKGVVRTDLSADQAKAIDAYTFRKDGGYFIRAEHLPALEKAHPKPGGAMPLTSQAPFWSPLERAVQGASMKSAPAGGWQQFLKGLVSKGVKPDEIAWSGIEDWLKLQDGKVSRDAVLAYLREGGVRVTETMKSGEPADAPEWGTLNDGDGTQPKFSQYTLPGGKDYRELLLTLPQRELPGADSAVADAAEAARGVVYREYEQRILAVEDELEQMRARRVPRAVYDEAWARRQALFNERDAKVAALPPVPRRAGFMEPAKFSSGHWDEANILAHVRFNERTDANGKRVLFIEEIQSDWAQQGKRHGFKTDVAPAPAGWATTDNARGTGVIPRAPFVGKTDAWVGLAIKRMVKYAVDGGFDRVAFVNGEQSAARYDLSKQVRSIVWTGRGNDTEKHITITPNDGNDIEFMVQPDGAVGSMGGGSIGNEFDGKRLDEIVGKEIADRIMGAKYGDMHGNGLKVGGEGMKAFYDKIVPTVAKDVVRKLGGQLSTADVSQHRQSINGGEKFTYGTLTDESERHWVIKEATNEQVAGPFATWDESHDWLIAHDPATTKSSPQLGFDVTDAMRAAAADGLPLFRDGEPAAPARRGVDPAALRDDVARLTAQWDNAPEITVVNSAFDLPAEIRRQLVDMRAANKTRALIMPDTGHVYVIAQANATLDDARFALMHEVLGHYGIRGFLGDEDAYYRTMYQLRQANPGLAAEADEWLRQHGQGAIEGRIKRGLAPAEAMKEVRALATEEALADRAARNEPVRGWQKLVAKVQEFLRAIGWDGLADRLERMTQAETAQLLSIARWHVTGSAEPHLFTVDGERPLALTSQATTAPPAAAPAPATLKPSSAPLDTLLRIPGEQVARYITRPVAGWAARTIDATLNRIPGHAWATTKAGFVSDFGLADDYKDARAAMDTAIRKGTREAATVVDQLHGLSADEARVAYLWMQEKPDSAAEQRLMNELPPESRQILVDLKKRIDELGDMAEALGLISHDVRERYAGSYIHRSYKKYALGANKGERASAAASKSRAVKILGDQFKGRGLRDDVADTKIADPDWWQRRRAAGQADTSLKGAKFWRLEQRKTPDTATEDFVGAVERRLGKLQRVLYWPEGAPVPAHLADWRNDGLWEARFFDKGGKVGMWRDFTVDERTAMGEIQEVRYAAANTILAANRDVEVARMLKWVATNISEIDPGQLPAGAEVVPAHGDGLGLMVPYRPDQWVQVPDTSIPGTGLKQFGALAGRYIPGPVWNDLRQVSSLAGGNEWTRMFTKAMNAWKVSKTALSPATHMNNVMSNFVLADAHDIQARHVLGAMKAWLGVRKGRAVKDPAALALIHAYQDNGGDGGKFTEGELREELASKLIAQLEEDVGENGDPTTALVRAAQVLDLLKHGEVRQALATVGQTKAIGLSKKAVGVMVKAYGHEDEVFRLAAFIKAKADGLSDHDAGKFARESFIDYRINAPWIQVMRRTAWPFISFAYRVVPMMASIAINKPHKLAKWMLVAGGLNKLAYVMLAAGGFGGGLPPDELERRERAFLPDEKTGKELGAFPKLLRMPWNETMYDREGQRVGESPVFLDLRRWIPGGDFADTTDDKTPLPILSSLMPGGPLGLMGEVAGNKDWFTGQPITLQTDYLGERASKLGAFLWRGVAPNFPGLPGAYSTNNILDANSGKTDSLGRDINLPDALLKSIGIKVQSYPRDSLQQAAVLDAKAKLDEIMRGLRSQQRQFARNGISQAELDAAIARAQEKIKAITDKLARQTAQADGQTADATP